MEREESALELIGGVLIVFTPIIYLYFILSI
jgi:hypothetical protein